MQIQPSVYRRTAVGGSKRPKSRVFLVKALCEITRCENIQTRDYTQRLIVIKISDWPHYPSTSLFALLGVTRDFPTALGNDTPRGIMINFERPRRVTPRVGRHIIYDIIEMGRIHGRKRNRARRCEENERAGDQCDANTKIEIRDVSDVFRFAGSSRTKSQRNDARRYSTPRAL